MGHVYTPTATYHTTITFPSDGDFANQASIDPLEALADNDLFLKNEIEDPLTGIGALNLWVDSLAAENWPYEGLSQLLAAPSGDFLELYDFAVATTGAFFALVEDNTTGRSRVYTSTDLKNWVMDSNVINHSAAPSAVVSCAIAGAVNTVGALQFSATNLGVVKYVKGTSYGATTTSLPGAGNITQSPKCGAYFNGTYVWGLFDSVANGVVITSTDLVSVSRSAYGSLGDLNHIRGPIDWAVRGDGALLVGLGNSVRNAITQNATFILTSTDGISFSEVAIPTVNPGKEAGSGIVWNAERGVFLVATTDLVSHAVRIYQSANGTAWSLLCAIGAPAGGFLSMNCDGIASVGNTILLLLSPTAGRSYERFTYSPDFGATWLTVPRLTYDVSSYPNSIELQGKVTTKDGQMIFGNATHLMGSLVLRQQGLVVT